MCSIYAKLSLRNDGPGDGALLSRRASSVSGRITPELLFLVRGQRTVKTEPDYQEKAKRKKKKRKRQWQSFCHRPNRSYLLLRVILSSLPFNRYIFSGLSCTLVIDFTFPTTFFPRLSFSFLTHRAS